MNCVNYFSLYFNYVRGGRIEMRSQWPSCAPVLSVHLLIIRHSCMESRGFIWKGRDSRSLHSLINYLQEVYDDLMIESRSLLNLSHTCSTHRQTFFLCLIDNLSFFGAFKDSLKPFCLSSVSPYTHVIALLHAHRHSNSLWKERDDLKLLYSSLGGRF